MNVLKTIGFLFLLPTLLAAQRIHPKVQIEWEKNFGSGQSEYFTKVIENQVGNFAAIGQTDSTGTNSDIFFLVANESGIPVLQKQYGSQQKEAAYSLIEAMDSGYLIGGYTESSTDSSLQKKALLLKTDDLGEQLWQQSYGTEGINEIKDIIQLKDESLIVTGQKNGNLWLARLSPKGDIIWEHSLKGFPSVGNSLALTDDEDIIVAGDIQVLNEEIGSQVSLVKADKDGNVFWVNNYDDAGAKRSTKVIILDNGDFAVAGHSVSRVYREDMLLLITDPNGLVKIAKSYGGKKSDGGEAIAQAPNGDLYIVGFSKERTDPDDSGWVNRVSFATGERVWTKDRENFLSNKLSDHIYDIIIASDGSPVLVGSTNRLGKKKDAWMIKLTTEGLPDIISPPSVSVSPAMLMDENRDSILSPDERAFISLEISNNSTQPLYNVQARCSTNSPQDIDIIPIAKIGKIKAQSTKVVTLPIKTNTTIRDNTHRVAIDFIEANNADIPSLIFELKTSVTPFRFRVEKSN